MMLSLMIEYLKYLQSMHKVDQFEEAANKIGFGKQNPDQNPQPSMQKNIRVEGPVPTVQAAQNAFDGQYTYGQFQQFAIKNQQKKFELEHYIQKLIEQALQSHFKALRTYQQEVQKLKKIHTEVIQQLKTLLHTQFDETENMLLKYVAGTTSPRQFVTYLKNLSSNWDYRFKVMISLPIAASKLVVVDNKLIPLQKLNQSQVLKQGQQTFFGLKQSNLFIKIGKTNQFTFKMQDGFRNLVALRQISQQQKKIILTQIQSFLKQKGILYTQAQLSMDTIQKAFKDK